MTKRLNILGNLEKVYTYKVTARTADGGRPQLIFKTPANYYLDATAFQAMLENKLWSVCGCQKDSFFIADIETDARKPEPALFDQEEIAYFQAVGY